MIDAEEFRKAIRTFATGVTVITVPTSDGMHGMTASSFASVSVNPRLISINVAKVARAHKFMCEAERYGINLLLESQADLANYFAGRFPGKRIPPDYEWVEGCPVLAESLGYFACRKWAQYEGGDHTIFVGEVQKMVRTDARPLVCCRGRFHELGPRSAGSQPLESMITT